MTWNNLRLTGINCDSVSKIKEPSPGFARPLTGRQLAEISESCIASIGPGRLNVIIAKGETVGPTEI